jgi:hypothetical protein
MFYIIGQFRMPLHEQAKPAIDPFQSFDNPILAAGCNYQPHA